MNYLKDYVRFVVGKKVFYLPSGGFDMYEREFGYTFDVPMGQCVIVDGKKYCNNVIEYNKFTGELIGPSPQSCEMELVEAFIKQNFTMHRTIIHFLRANPSCFDNTTSLSMVSANPNSWIYLSNALYEFEDHEAKELLIKMVGEEPTIDDLFYIINGNIGANEVSELFFEFYKREKK